MTLLLSFGLTCPNHVIARHVPAWFLPVQSTIKPAPLRDLGGERRSVGRGKAAFFALTLMVRRGSGANQSCAFFGAANFRKIRFVAKSECSLTYKRRKFANKIH
jgi:hypothetical protein